MIQPIIPITVEAPECSLKIFEISDTASSDAAQALTEQLNKSYDNVSEASKSDLIDGLFLHADNGTAWNAEQVDVYFVDNLLGSTYILTASYFTEATEGHGARFTDMIGTFKVVATSDSTTIPTYLVQLRSAVDTLIPAFFSNQTSEIGNLLTESAEIYLYDKNVMDDVSIRAIDYTVDDNDAPTAAVVSIKHRLGTEDSFNYLTIELSYTDGQWLVDFAGIEK